MDWVKLMTEFDGNPKVLSVGLAGAGLYARALCFCGRYETDGVIPKVWVDHAVAHEGLADLPERLVAAGLWETCDSGYEIRDFTALNRSRSEMENLREKRAVAGKTGGEANGKAKRKQTPSYSFSASEFSEWLRHYHAVTGRTTVRGSSSAKQNFGARRREGRTLDDLKLATVGCHSDDFLRERGFDTPDTILRASKVERYAELGRKAQGRPALTAVVG